MFTRVVEITSKSGKARELCNTSMNPRASVPIGSVKYFLNRYPHEQLCSA
jgi:hypothetical protein